MGEFSGNSMPNLSEVDAAAISDVIDETGVDVNWADLSPRNYKMMSDAIQNVSPSTQGTDGISAQNTYQNVNPNTNQGTNTHDAPQSATTNPNTLPSNTSVPDATNLPDAANTSNSINATDGTQLNDSPDAPSPAGAEADAEKAQADYQAEKNKWVNGGWAKMVHWYKQHPEEVGDIMFVGAEHDEEWYQKNPDGIGNLVRDRLKQEATLAAEIAADSNSTAIDPKAISAMAKRELSNEYQAHLAKEAALKAKLEAEEKAAIEFGDKKSIEDGDKESHEAEEGAYVELTDEQKNLLKAEIDIIDEEKRALDEIISLESAGGTLDLDEIDRGLARDEETDRQLDSLIKERNYYKRELAICRDQLAESYARNRRLIVGKKNRLEYDKAQEKYQLNLESYLRAQAKIAKIHQDDNCEFAKRKELITLGQKVSTGKITAVEAKKALVDKCNELDQASKTAVSAEFTKYYLEEQNALEKATTDMIDGNNGNLYRKAVSKILNNKKFKIALAAAGAAGLAVSLASGGLLTGAMAVGLKYTASGVAMGAGKGALSGLIMSRQDSKHSAVNNFMGNEDEIARQLEGIDTSNDENIANVTKWLVNQYEKAKQTDNKSNHRRTLIAMGLGAALGGAASGIQFNKITTEEITSQRFDGYEPTKIRAAANLNKLNHAEGTGTQQLFRELGGDGDTYYSSGAHDVMTKVFKKYDIALDENNWTEPGKIREWSDVAQAALKKVAREWAKKGLIPASTTGGQPIYTPVTETVTSMLRDRLSETFKDVATNITAGLTGNAIANRTNRITTPESLQLF